MFTKGEGEASGEARGGAAGGRSHLAADLKIKGNLSSGGTIEVMGEVDGDIDARTLVIGSGGKVSGKVRAETIEVRGELTGSASCYVLTLRSSAVVTVQVSYDTLVIESGAVVEGKFKHAPRG